MLLVVDYLEPNEDLDDLFSGGCVSKCNGNIGVDNFGIMVEDEEKLIKDKLSQVYQIGDKMHPITKRMRLIEQP
jgi:hypothetical protein